LDFFVKNDGSNLVLAPNDHLINYIKALDGDDGVMTTSADKFFSKQFYSISKTSTRVVRLTANERQCGESPGSKNHNIIYQWYIW